LGCDGKVAIVTGTGDGLGRDHALLASGGAQVADETGRLGPHLG
jgi:NAD(P)-dependent dehydrogenase (short-subunit alcohol dehydrogenase family)